MHRVLVDSMGRTRDRLATVRFLLSLAFVLWVPIIAGATQEQPVVPSWDSGRGLLILADFDDMQENTAGRSNTGGLFATWSSGQEQHCKQSFESEDALGLREGRALRLNYTVVPNPHYNGWYLFTASGSMKGLDLRRYDRLGFFVKGDTAFTVEVKDRASRDDGSPGGVAEYVVTTATDEWQQVEIPWYMFSPKDQKTVIDWGGVRQFVIIFSDARSKPKGEIMVDHLYVSRGTPTF